MTPKPRRRPSQPAKRRPGQHRAGSKTPAQPHDAGYKAIFSSPEPVRDLLLGFVDLQGLPDIDFSTLEKMPDSYLTDSLHARANDVVWRVKVGQQWGYLYLMLEFQSRIDKYMAVRMLVYVGLLYQALIKRGDVLADGQLPPILPLVLYNGGPRWTAATNMAELIPALPDALQAYRPQMSYLLIDEGSYSDAQLAGLHNIAAALFRVENLCAPETIQQLIDQLDLWTADNQALKGSIAEWLRAIFMRHSQYTLSLPEVQTLKEIKMALAERMAEWAEAYKAQGLRAGVLQGIEQGIEQGLEQGIEQGLERGRRSEAANLLLTLLRGKFGAVTDDIAAHVQESSADVIESWFRRAITAPNLSAVFSDAAPPH